jgi:hypothetical protein
MGINVGGHTGRVRARASLVGLAATLALLSSAVSARAAGATISSYAYSNTYTTTDVQDSVCSIPAATLTGTVTEFGHGQIIESAQGVTVHSEDDMTYHLAFPDGSYVDGRAQSHATFNAHGSVTVYTDPVVEPRTYYTADGEPIGTLIIHYIGHITYDSASGDVRGAVDRFFISCT